MTGTAQTRVKAPTAGTRSKSAPTPVKTKSGPQKAFMNVHKRMPGRASNDTEKAIRRVECPEAFRPLFAPARYKVFHGGRGGAKSWAFSRTLLILGYRQKLRILCAREHQTTIADSVKTLLDDQIRGLGLSKFYRSTDSKIKGRNGTEFKFTGLRINPDDMRSFEGSDICWIEEAHRVSAHSWAILDPTIRKPGSEVWISFNPDSDKDPMYSIFVTDPPPDAVVVKVGFRDNPWFPDVLENQRRYMLETDPDAYDWIWEGNCRKISNAVIFRGKFAIEEFETPADARFYFGADWGFGPDPTVLIRCFVQGKTLFVDQECYAFGLDLDRIAATWRAAVPECDKWPIYADDSQPQTINHVQSFGFRMEKAKRYQGSVEDGIAFLRSFERIIVHPRCYHTGEEMRLYSYKTDRISGDVLPVVLDRHNHCIDSIRYALYRLIRCQSIATWEKLGAL